MEHRKWWLLGNDNLHHCICIHVDNLQENQSLYYVISFNVDRINWDLPVGLNPHSYVTVKTLRIKLIQKHNGQSLVQLLAHHLKLLPGALLIYGRLYFYINNWTEMWIKIHVPNFFHENSFENCGYKILPFCSSVDMVIQNMRWH